MTTPALKHACQLCGLANDNSKGAQVLRYTLLRSVSERRPGQRRVMRTKSFGQVSLCAICLREIRKGPRQAWLDDPADLEEETELVS